MWPQGPPDDVEHWLFSGEPECAPGDLLLGTERDHGLGGAAFCIGGALDGEPCGDHTGDRMIVHALDDERHLRPYLTLTIAWNDHDGVHHTARASGCGTTDLVVPLDEAPHFPPAPGSSRWAWARVATAHVDPLFGDVCLGTRGILEVTI